MNLEEKTKIMGTEPLEQIEVPQEKLERNCPNCGQAILESEKYCPTCGYERGSWAKAIGRTEKKEPILKLKIGEEVYELSEGEYVIGRNEGDIVIANPYLSRRHSKIKIEHGKAYLVDLGSTNGTFLDGVRLSPNEEKEIPESSKLKFGELDGEVTFISSAGVSASIDVASSSDEDELEKTSIPEKSEEEPSSQNLIEITSTWELLIGEERRAVPFGKIRIGRKPERNDISFPDDRYVSGEHLLLDVDLEYLKVQDLASTNGAFINDRKIAPNEWIQINDGDEIRIGQTKIVVRKTPPPVEPVKEEIESQAPESQVKSEAEQPHKGDADTISEPCEVEGLDESDEPLED